MVNGHAIAHGGYVFTLADSAFAFACNTYGSVTVARAAEVVFLAPARTGDDLVATAAERTRSGRNGIYDVTVHGARSTARSSRSSGATPATSAARCSARRDSPFSRRRPGTRCQAVTRQNSLPSGSRQTRQVRPGGPWTGDTGDAPSQRA